LRFTQDYLVVQWYCRQIYSTEAGTPHAMLVGILHQILLQVGDHRKSGTKGVLDSLDKAEKDACSIECLTDLLRENLQQLPENKTVVVIIERGYFRYQRVPTFQSGYFEDDEVFIARYDGRCHYKSKSQGDGCQFAGAELA
jgi:hypothetical protein